MAIKLVIMTAMYCVFVFGPMVAEAAVRLRLWRPKARLAALIRRKAPALHRDEAPLGLPQWGFRRRRPERGPTESQAASRFL